MTAPVWLVGSHHNFYNGFMFATLDEMPEAKRRGWKPLLPEYLGRRMANSSGKLVSEQWNAVYMAALSALMQLDGFVSVVSLCVLEGDKDRIQYSKREWGRIYLAGSNEYVVNFSHDTRNGSPFYGLLGWLEDPQFDTNGEVTIGQLRQYSNVEVWRKFFIDRIEKELCAEQDRVTELASKQQSISAHAHELQSALNQLVAN